MRKFFIQQSDIQNNDIFIEGENFNHIKNVLRMKVGNKLEVSNEVDTYECIIEAFYDDKVKLSIISKVDIQREPPVNITLYQGIPKGDKMELIIQKNTELGVKAFVPVMTERVVVKLDDKSGMKKVERWQKIADEACKQCKRDTIPEVKNIQSISEIVKDFKNYDIVFTPYEAEKDNGLKAIFNNKNFKNIAVIIGPEGGFAESEIDLLENNNAKIVTLGPRIFRTETAGLVMNSILMYEFGDIK